MRAPLLGALWVPQTQVGHVHDPSSPSAFLLTNLGQGAANTQLFEMTQPPAFFSVLAATSMNCQSCLVARDKVQKLWGGVAQKASEEFWSHNPKKLQRIRRKWRLDEIKA